AFPFAALSPASTSPLPLHDALPIFGKKPAALSHVDAAALALTGLTAICAIEEALKLKAGETILIQGGAGGDGLAGLELQRLLDRSEEHTSELQSRRDLVCRLLLEKK